MTDFETHPIGTAKEIERLTADVGYMGDECISLRKRIAKLEGALNWFRFNSSPEGMGRAIEALEEVDDGS